MVRFANWKAVVVILLCLTGGGLAAPNLFSQQFADSLPDWLPHRQISLGLDLQGGSHLLLEVETDTVVSEQLEGIVDAARDVLREARIRYTGLRVDGNTVITVTILDPDDVVQARKLLSDVDPETTIDVDEGGRLVITLSERALRERRASAVQQSIEIIRRRIDETGVREPTIQMQGADRILVQLPGVNDPERIKALIGKTAKMTFHLVDDRDRGFGRSTGDRAPAGTALLPMADARQPGQGDQQKLLVRKRVVVSGENLVDAQPTFQDGRPIVSFRFDTVGGKRFGDATSHNVGRLLAIVLDGEIISAPRIQTAIIGGSGVITGSFTVAEARDLALLLRAGALPAPLKILEERTVGPGLGTDSIAAGKLASVVGLALVAVFMLAAYGLFGVFAVIALFINLVLIFGALSALQATLTLPGIAGIVLTIGMAVDANVLIFEHIREEVAAGRTPISAVDAGFTRALATIVDSNLTTLFAAVLLYIFGSGPVRGFGVTLSIGIVTSMFTAMMVTRLMVVTWLSRTRPTLIPI